VESRISAITLGVADLARAIAFYRRLGWKQGAPTEGVAFFQANGLVLCLFPIPDLAKDAGVKIAARPPPARPLGNISIAYNVRSRRQVATELSRAAKAGGTIVKPAQPAFWGGVTGYFADPDGHLWEVAWNPFWKIDRRGNVSLPRR
jgi:catechol 2,3-dioxygenase-like lactoylglutathione lyase family enzyme